MSYCLGNRLHLIIHRTSASLKPRLHLVHQQQGQPGHLSLSVPRGTTVAVCIRSPASTWPPPPPDHHFPLCTSLTQRLLPSTPKTLPFGGKKPTEFPSCIETAIKHTWRFVLWTLECSFTDFISLLTRQGSLSGIAGIECSRKPSGKETPKFSPADAGKEAHGRTPPVSAHLETTAECKEVSSPSVAGVGSPEADLCPLPVGICLQSSPA